MALIGWDGGALHRLGALSQLFYVQYILSKPPLTQSKITSSRPQPGYDLGLDKAVLQGNQYTRL